MSATTRDKLEFVYAKELRKEIRELRAYMKANGIPVTSCFNGGHTPESYRCNARLFELKMKLQKVAQ